LTATVKLLASQNEIVEYYYCIQSPMNNPENDIKLIRRLIAEGVVTEEEVRNAPIVEVSLPQEANSDRMTDKSLRQLKAACEIAGCSFEENNTFDIPIYYITLDDRIYLGWLVFASEDRWIANVTGKYFPFPPMGMTYTNPCEALLSLTSFRLKHLGA
jgi:hypothetical protein